MKNLFTKFVLLTGAALVTLALLPVTANSQIVSAPGGGLWSVASTWLGGNVPTAGDDVIIASTVYANGNSCNNIEVNSGGILQNHSSNNYSLHIHGNLTNNGVISNYSGFGLLLNVYGNITNNATMSNTTLNLSGSGNQQISSGQPLYLVNFTKSTQAGRGIAISDLSFVGTNISLLSDTLEFTGNSQLLIDGGSLTNAIIYKSSLPALKITAGNGTYAANLTLSSPQTEFYGSLLINGSSNYFRNNFINYGTLKNYPNNSFTLHVAGNFTNNGTLQNNVYPLLLNITGNVVNNATWANYRTTLSGTANQELSMTQAFSGTELIRTNGAGRIRATSALDFAGTEFNLTGDTLEFTTGNAITLNGGGILSGVVYKSSLPALSMNNDNGTYFNNLVVDAPQLQLAGSLIINGSSVILKSDVINNGTLRNYQNNSYTLQVPGNFTNNGTVTDNVYGFYINISGNLTNNGVWNNYGTTLNGTTNQVISMTQPFAGHAFTRTPGTGRLIAATDLSFMNTLITLNNDTLQFTTGSGITLSGGCINPGILYKTSLPALIITSGEGAYLENLKVDSPETELYGTVTIYGSSHNFKTSLINYGTLQNYPNNSYLITINGNITNNGTIQNNVYDLNLNISGNLTNNGVWTNRTTTLNGAVNQLVSMSQPFGGSFFERVNANGRLQANTDLSFVNTIISLNSDTLEFTSGSSLTMNGGYLNTGTLYKTALPALKITTNGGNYITNQVIDAPQTEFYGVVMIYGSSHNFKNNVIINGTLQNRPNNTYLLTINGNITNNGTIQNNVYDLNLTVSGNLTNNGVWTNRTTTLNGAANQLVSMSQPFGGSFFERVNANGRLQAISNLGFTNTIISLNSDTLEFTSGNSLTMTGGYLNTGTLYKTAMPALKITTGGGNYITNQVIDAPQTEFYGVVMIYGNSHNFKNMVIINGTLQNRQSSTYLLTINGDIINNGTIQNNVYDLNLNISGNLINNGIWKNRTTTLTGTSAHSFAFTQGFEGALLINNNADGNINATTSLTFDGTDLDFNGCLVTLPDGGYFSVLNGSFFDASVSGVNLHFKCLGAYCQNIAFLSDVTLHGVFQAGSGVTFAGGIVNEGTIRNRGVSSYGIQVQGDIHNNGSVMDNIYSFSITVLGDVYNNGIWGNYLTILDGTTDQNIYLINGKSITGTVRLDANFTGSGLAWWGPTGSLIGNPGFSGAGTLLLTFLNPVSDALAGQYYCANNTGAHSRNIFIHSQLNPVRILSLNLLLEGLYNSNGIMNPSLDAAGNPVWNSGITDQITVELHDQANFSNIVFSKDEILLSTSGAVTVAVPAAYSSNYYIAIRHRSGIITASAAPVPFTTPEITYSFDQAGKAYGNNMALMPDGWYAFYGGDVNQDGVVDTGDMTPVDNGSAAYLSGYRNPDANGDGIIDTADMTLVDNNSANFVMAICP